MPGPDARTSLSARVLGGDLAALARLLTRVENDDVIGRAALAHLYPRGGSAHLIGITGPPGAGKSTLVNEMLRAYRARGAKVAIIAIDPTSPLTGGAMLGDRIRMTEWHADPGVFIRSMASRRFGGGLAQNALAVANVFDAAGFDPVIIETVGTGQDEVAIARLALTTLLVQVPGMGDGVQTLKAGALEIGDIIVIAKADRPEASELASDLRRLRTLNFDDAIDPGSWSSPVVKTSATSRTGIDDLIAEIERHREWLAASGELDGRLRRNATTELASRVRSGLLMRSRDRAGESGQFEALVDEITSRVRTPQAAAEILLAAMAR